MERTPGCKRAANHPAVCKPPTHNPSEQHGIHDIMLTAKRNRLCQASCLVRFGILDRELCAAGHVVHLQHVHSHVLLPSVNLNSATRNRLSLPLHIPIFYLLKRHVSFYYWSFSVNVFANGSRVERWQQDTGILRLNDRL